MVFRTVKDHCREGLVRVGRAEVEESSPQLVRNAYLRDGAFDGADAACTARGGRIRQSELLSKGAPTAEAESQE